MNNIDDSRQRKRAQFALDLPVVIQNNKIKVIILQHPREPDKELGTAALAVRALENAKLKVGLSWPSLTKIVGETANPSNWAVLYLGSKNKNLRGEVNVVDKKNNLLSDPFIPEGIVALDGNWSQAKAIWWRNAWLLKLKRIVLHPKTASLYGKLRKEPRSEALSTIESIALCLQYFEKDKTIAVNLNMLFSEFLNKYREYYGS